MDIYCGTLINWFISITISTLWILCQGMKYTWLLENVSSIAFYGTLMYCIPFSSFKACLCFLGMSYCLNISLIFSGYLDSNGMEFIYGEPAIFRESLLYQCRKCCKVIKRKVCLKSQHQCGEKRCPSCKKIVAENHMCYLQKESAKKSNEKLIFFDFETDQSTGEHIVNFVVSQYLDGTEFVCEGCDAIDKFCKYLFSPQHKGFTAIAHNMKGFDGQFILRWMLEQGQCPGVIPNGSKIMCIILSALNIRIIDSFNFFPMSLSKLPKTFGLEELAKGYFPHLCNCPSNQSYVGSFPDSELFSPSTMSTGAREKFFMWYNGQKTNTFDFKKEMLKYCRSDVDILRRCCKIFREQFQSVTGVDPFTYVTIASACMTVYRSGHIKPKTIAMVPVQGYCNSTNFSRDGIR